MNLQQQEKFVDEFLGKMRATMLSKGNDYANVDRLSNFKLAGAICGLTPEQNCLSMIATKVARLGVLLAGKTPNNESIEDSLLDLSNYGALLACLREEKLDIIPISEPPYPNVQDSNTSVHAGITVEGKVSYDDELVRIGKEDRGNITFL